MKSENNLNKCWTGWMDVNLTEKGFEDAKCAGAIIEKVKFDKVYSSDLKRAVDTAKTALPGYEIEKTSLIREINVGKCAGKTFAECNEKYSHIEIDNYVIMPNHFHLILNIKDYKNGVSETAAPYNNETSKFVSLLKRYCNREYGENIWQSSCNDHIIRGEKDYQKIWEYIDTNVIRWEKDCFYND